MPQSSKNVMRTLNNQRQARVDGPASEVTAGYATRLVIVRDKHDPTIILSMTHEPVMYQAPIDKHQERMETLANERLERAQRTEATRKQLELLKEQVDSWASKQ